MSPTTQQIEREVETSRANVEDTVEALKGKMSLGQMVDEAARYIGGTNMVSNLGAQVRANPIPLALVGLGIAWLMSGRGIPRMRSSRDDEYGEDYGYDADVEFYDGDYDSQSRLYGTRSGYSGSRYSGVNRGDVWNNPTGADTTWSDESSSDGGRSWTGAASGALGSVASGARSAVHGVASVAGSAASTVGSTLSSAAGSVSGGARYAARSARRGGMSAYEGASWAGSSAYDGAAYMGSRARSTFSDLLDEEPLVLGALGIAVGAAMGAFLPRTETEDRYLGQYRDQFRDEAERYAREQYHKGKAVAAEALRRAKDEAEAQGLSPSAVADRVREAARDIGKAAKDGAKDAAEEKGLGQTGTGQTSTGRTGAGST